MLISGIQPLTLIDYPDRIACIVFTPGCNFRCGYCHNPEFVLPERIIELKDSFIPERAFFNFLESRRGMIEGVVISGGEPTLAPDLESFIKKIKQLGFLVKLDTNGNRPDVLERLLDKKLLDYIAMDVKTSLEEYTSLVGPLVRPERIKQSIEFIKNSGIDYEFRSTLIKETHSDTILAAMADLVAGARRWYLQKFRPGHTLSVQFAGCHAFSDEEMFSIAERFQHKLEKIIVRN